MHNPAPLVYNLRFDGRPAGADSTCTFGGEVLNYVVELQNPALLVPCPSGVCGSGICVLNYDITFIRPDAVEAGDFVECDGTAHLFIDDAWGSEGFAGNGLTQSGPYFD